PGNSCAGTVLVVTQGSFRTTTGGPAGQLRVLFAYVTIQGNQTRLVSGRVPGLVAAVLRRGKSVRVRVTTSLTWSGGTTHAASAGPAGRWIHYGLTSSDVLDTGLALQLRRVAEVVLPASRRLVEAQVARARQHAHTLTIGRTHGIHAEPTTFGIKLASYAFEAERNAQRLEGAFAQASVGAISGAVGTYASTSPDFERRVLDRLGLEPEPVSTPVVARDRHA